MSWNNTYRSFLIKGFDSKADIFRHSNLILTNSKGQRALQVYIKTTLIANKIKLSKFGTRQIEIALSKTSINFVSACSPSGLGRAAHCIPRPTSQSRAAAAYLRPYSALTEAPFIKNHVKPAPHTRSRQPSVRSCGPPSITCAYIKKIEYINKQWGYENVMRNP